MQKSIEKGRKGADRYVEMRVHYQSLAEHMAYHLWWQHYSGMSKLGLEKI